jgi:hypothetical protein
VRVLALVREDFVVQRHEVSGLQGADRFNQAVHAAVDLHFGRSWVSHLAFDLWDPFASEASLHATHLSPRGRFSAGHVRMGRFNSAGGEGPAVGQSAIQHLRKRLRADAESPSHRPSKSPRWDRVGAIRRWVGAREEGR